MTDETISCVTPAGESAIESDSPQSTDQSMEVEMTVARAGAKAPEFEAMAYFEGGFQKVKLSDYAGKWTVICFYPGDFTFV